MRVAIGIFAWGTVFGLTAAAPVSASDFVAGRAGIERIQAETGTSGPRSGIHPRSDAEHKGAHQPPPDGRRNDEDSDDAGGEAGSGVNPSPDVKEPPGCIYRQEPLGLIV